MTPLSSANRMPVTPCAEDIGDTVLTHRWVTSGLGHIDCVVGVFLRQLPGEFHVLVEKTGFSKN